MNFDYSIESKIDKIQNINTRKYFTEVYQTFANGNYRSSTVMLYSVLICDLVFKLRDLRDIYNDNKARKIIEEIEELQQKNPTSPEWESKLVELIKDRTSLLESSDIIAIENLQRYRHLSAHPVLNSSDILFSPNKETIQALIRNILENILTSPPFFSNKIFDTMLADLARVKNMISNIDDLDNYVNTRYIKHLKQVDLLNVFRSLWKIVFITDNELSNTNRSVNYKVLKIIIKRNRGICSEALKSEIHFYSNINKEELISYLIRLLTIYPELYEHLENPLKVLIVNKIEISNDHKLIAWFIKPNIREHLTTLNPSDFTSLSSKSFDFMSTLCVENSCLDELIFFAIKYFGGSISFDNTLDRYNNSIELFEDKLSLNHVVELLNVSNSNFQINQRYGIDSKIKKIAEKYITEINKSEYPNIYHEPEP